MLLNILGLASLACTLGLATSIGLSFVVQKFIFQGEFIVAVLPLTIIGLLAVAISLIAGSGLLSISSKEI